VPTFSQWRLYSLRSTQEEYFIKGFEPQKPCGTTLIGSSKHLETIEEVATAL
jgi:hypothetical protein